jgi:formyl-CoA transferase
MKPLNGITVLDLGQVYGGPYCALLLGHLGARVIKIESPTLGEPLRSRRGDNPAVEPFAFQLLNGGKQSVALDLKHEEDRAVFFELVEMADVVVENFAPGTAASLGVDYGPVRDRNPRIVYASLKAYSADSPDRSQRGMDLTVQASSAVMSVNGFPDGPPVRVGPSLVDFLGGSHLALGVMGALVERSVTGVGQQVDVALQDAVIPAMASNIAGRLTDPEHALERTGNRHGGMRESPYNTYQTADGWVAVLCLTGQQWLSLCQLMDRPDLRDDPSLSAAAGRVARMHEIDAAVEAWTKQYPTEEVVAGMQRAAVPAARLKTVAELIADEMGRTAPMIQHVEGPEGTFTYTFGSPVRLANHPPEWAGPVARLGQDTAAVLDELARRRQDGVGAASGAAGAAGGPDVPAGAGGEDLTRSHDGR